MRGECLQLACKWMCVLKIEHGGFALANVYLLVLRPRPQKQKLGTSHTAKTPCSWPKQCCPNMNPYQACSSTAIHIYYCHLLCQSSTTKPSWKHTGHLRISSPRILQRRCCPVREKITVVRASQMWLEDVGSRFTQPTGKALWKTHKKKKKQRNKFGRMMYSTSCA